MDAGLPHALSVSAEHVPAAVASLRGGRIVRSNRLFAALAGREPEQLVGVATKKLLRPDLAAEHLPPEGLVAPVVLIDLEGRERLLSVALRPQPSADGADALLVAVELDCRGPGEFVPDAGRAPRFACLFRALPWPAFLWRRDGDDVVLVAANRRGREEWFGHVEELLGRRASVIYRGQPDVLEDFRSCMAAEDSVRREMTYRFVTVGGERRVAVTYVFVPPDWIVVHVQDVEETRRTSAELARCRARLEDLGSELVLAEERDRLRRAAELHDLVAQPMALARLQLERLATGPAPRAVEEGLRELSASLEEATLQVRALLADMSSPSVREGTLTEALSALAERARRRGGLEVDLECGVAGDGPTPELRILLLQAARELLQNVVRHARARRAVVAVHPEGDHALRLEVRDDGRGFTAGEGGPGAAASFGLSNLRARLQIAGGSLAVTSTPGEGTCVAVTLPTETAGLR